MLYKKPSEEMIKQCRRVHSFWFLLKFQLLQSGVCLATFLFSPAKRNIRSSRWLEIKVWVWFSESDSKHLILGIFIHPMISCITKLPWSNPFVLPLPYNMNLYADNTLVWTSLLNLFYSLQRPLKKLLLFMVLHLNTCSFPVNQWRILFKINRALT